MFLSHNKILSSWIFLVCTCQLFQSTKWLKLVDWPTWDLIWNPEQWVLCYVTISYRYPVPGTTTLNYFSTGKSALHLSAELSYAVEFPSTCTSLVSKMVLLERKIISLCFCTSTLERKHYNDFRQTFGFQFYSYSICIFVIIVLLVLPTLERLRRAL